MDYCNLVDRVIKARGYRPAGRVLIEIEYGGERVGLALCETSYGRCWHEVNWYSVGPITSNRRAWLISGVPIGYGMKENRDWSLRGWLCYYLWEMQREQSVILSKIGLDELARSLEIRAGLPDSGPHERYQREGEWINSAGVRYPYEMFWRPMKEEVEVNGC